jgi:hypothetical protein
LTPLILVTSIPLGGAGRDDLLFLPRITPLDPRTDGIDLDGLSAEVVRQGTQVGKSEEDGSEKDGTGVDRGDEVDREWCWRAMAERQIR